jgi:hypothetical protein
VGDTVSTGGRSRKQTQQSAAEGAKAVCNYSPSSWFAHSCLICLDHGCIIESIERHCVSPTD